MRPVFSFLLAVTATVGCSKTPEPPKVPLNEAPVGTPSATAAAPATVQAISGTVTEQLSAPPYIYLRVSTINGDVWAAVPATDVKTGSQVTLNNPMLMTKFESKSLKRTFDEVYFATLGPASPTAAPAPMGESDNPHANATAAATSITIGKVEKAAGADARTIAELWAQKASLVGKTVTIRGVVVKSNEHVMGKNWLHLEDGSGNAAAANNDITVTSADHASVGETVTITGAVRTNKDFGMGYTYAVLVEDAKVVKK